MSQGYGWSMLLVPLVHCNLWSFFVIWRYNYILSFKYSFMKYIATIFLWVLYIDFLWIHFSLGSGQVKKKSEWRNNSCSTGNSSSFEKSFAWHPSHSCHGVWKWYNYHESHHFYTTTSNCVFSSNLSFTNLKVLIRRAVCSQLRNFGIFQNWLLE